MNRIVVGILFVLVTVSAVSGAEVTIGPKVGYVKSGFRGSDWSDFKDLFTDLDERWGPGFTGGLFIHPQFSQMFGIEIDLLYTHSAVRYGSSSYWQQESYNLVSVPVYLRFDFGIDTTGYSGSDIGFYLLAGPKIDYYFDTVSLKDSDGATGEDSLDDNDYARLYIGLGLGAGMAVMTQTGRLDIGVVYNTPFTKLHDSVEMYFEGFEFQLGYGFRL